MVIRGQIFEGTLAQDSLPDGGSKEYCQQVSAFYTLV